MGSDYAVSTSVAVLLMAVIAIASAVTVYAYSTGMIKLQGDKIFISYNVNKISNTLTITQKVPYKYAEGTTPNLVFVDEDGNRYYVQDNMKIGTGISNLRQTIISGGDVIWGFNDGTYTIVWEPTKQVLGTVKF